MTDAKGIAETFASYFESVYSNLETAEHDLLKQKFNDTYTEYFSKHFNDNISPYYLSWSDMTVIASKIPLGKSSSGTCKPEQV